MPRRRIVAERVLFFLHIVRFSEGNIQRFASRVPHSLTFATLRDRRPPTSPCFQNATNMSRQLEAFQGTFFAFHARAAVSRKHFVSFFFFFLLTLSLTVRYLKSVSSEKVLFDSCFVRIDLAGTVSMGFYEKTLSYLLTCADRALIVAASANVHGGRGLTCFITLVPKNRWENVRAPPMVVSDARRAL